MSLNSTVVVFIEVVRSKYAKRLQFLAIVYLLLIYFYYA